MRDTFELVHIFRQLNVSGQLVIVRKGAGERKIPNTETRKDDVGGYTAQFNLMLSNSDASRRSRNRSASSFALGRASLGGWLDLSERTIRVAIALVFLGHSSLS